MWAQKQGGSPPRKVRMEGPQEHMVAKLQGPSVLLVPSAFITKQIIEGKLENFHAVSAEQ